MNTALSFKIYKSTSQLPAKWDELSVSNIFLSKEYLEVLEKSSPENMECFFIGFFQEEELIGIAISQFLDLNKLTSFGDRDKCIKALIRNFIFKNFASHVLIIGNNMLTGQNAYFFSDKIESNKALQTLKMASDTISENYNSKGIKIHITTFKDFYEKEFENLKIPKFNSLFRFSTQPNMVFTITENWKTEQDYIDALSKKYRDQYKRARKKTEGISKRKMNLDEIIKYEETIYDLYYYVAKNAPFNTFFLAKNHFRVFKEKLKDKFLFYGYFNDEKLIGFNTLIKNGESLDTYFLGYDETIQREKMLYLNMLYDMIGYGINKGFKEIIFARTALEIKSSVGAKPIKMYGIIKHSNPFLNKYMSRIFPYLEPETIWQERNPFKEVITN